MACLQIIWFVTHANENHVYESVAVGVEIYELLLFDDFQTISIFNDHIVALIFLNQQ